MSLGQSWKTRIVADKIKIRSGKNGLLSRGWTPGEVIRMNSTVALAALVRENLKAPPENFVDLSLLQEIDQSGFFKQLRKN
jgi:hypothetical protein